MGTVKKEATAENLTTASRALEDATRTLDPTTFAVVFNVLNAIAKEMSLTFEYSAWSSIIAAARDFSCAVYDAEIPPNALCGFDGLPIHGNTQPVVLGEIANSSAPRNSTTAI